MTMRFESCPDCYGRGEIYVEGWITCLKCNGTGQITTFDNVTARPPASGRSGCTGTGAGLVVLAILIVAFFGTVLNEPDTDGIPPVGVSQEAFERNPTAGKIKIEKCGNYYKYGYGRSRPYTYTFSSTPPHAEVDYITEGTTWGLGGRMLSRGQRIPRKNVMPIEHGFGNYMMSGDEKITCSNFYYSPPSTASAAERRLAR